MFSLSQTIGSLFAPSSQSVREEYLDKEYDTKRRNATVDLYSKVVEGLSSIDGSSGGNGSAHHWALVVSFEDESYRTLEGNQNDDGFLHAYYRKHKGDGMTKLKKLGSVYTSPSELRSVARDNALNGTRYDLVDNNCQDWAIRAAKNISADIGREIASVPRIAPVLSMARNMAVGGPMGIVPGLRW